jgi:hypothetical protein
MSWITKVQFQEVVIDFSLHHQVQNSSGTYSGSYTMGLLPSRIKQPELIADYSSLPSTQVKNVWSCNLHSHVYLHGIVLD